MPSDVHVLQGGSIASIVSRFGPLDEPIVRSYTRQLLSGAHLLVSTEGAASDSSRVAAKGFLLLSFADGSPQQSTACMLPQ